MRNLHTDFHSGCTLPRKSHQQCVSVPFSPHPQKCWLFFDLLMVVILTGVKWYLIVVLICMSLRNIGVQFVVQIAMSSLEKYLLRSSAHFSLVCLSISWCWPVWVLCILWILTVIRYVICNVFYHLICCFLILLIVSFTVQKLFWFSVVPFVSFAFLPLPKDTDKKKKKKICYKQCQNLYCLCFLLRVLWF